jgi:DNA-binding CsgD family transcriptional regulator/tetratricopeptide (TPR) repeat protein
MSSAGETGLVGRELELAAIETALGGLGKRKLTLITLSGDPGLGKTSLLRHAYGAARALGIPAGYGTASELERHTPLLAAGDALYDLLGELPGEPDTNPAQDGALSRYQHYRALTGLLDATRPGFLLCLDDVHWCDGASLEFVDHLLRRPTDNPGVVLCAWRPRQLPDRVAAALRTAHPRWTRTDLSLAPLTASETAQLVPSDDPEAAHLHELAEGNPLYLNALLSLDRSTWRTAPPLAHEAIRMAVGRELAGLPPEHVEVARTAAVLADQITVGDLATLTGRPQETVGRAVEDLIERDLLRPHPTRPNLLTFRHPLLRAHLYETAKIEWRRETHGRVAAALGKRGLSPARRAAHVVQHALPGDVEAARLLCRAAAEVLHTAPTSTMSWARDALRLLTGDQDPGLARQLSLLLGEALSLAGKPDQSLALLMRIRAEGKSDDAVGIRVAMNCAVLHRILGNYPQSRAVLEEKLGETDPDTPEKCAGVSRLHAELGSVLLMTGEPQRARAEFRTALQLALSQPTIEPKLGAYSAMALADAYGGDRRHRSRIRCAELVDGVEDAELGRALEAAAKLGWAEALTDQLTDASRHFARATKIARTTRQALLLPYLLNGASYVLCQLGELTEAIDAADTAEETALAFGDTQFRGLALSLRANAMLEHQGASQAVPFATQAMKLIEPRSWWGQVAGVILAKIRLHQGLPQDALELLTSRKQAVSVLPSSNGAQWMSTASAAALAVGDVTGARDWADAAQRSAEAFGSELQRSHADLATASVDARDGELDKAVVSASRAVQSFADHQAGIDEIRGRLKLAELLLARGDDVAASTHCATAKNAAAEHKAARLLQVSTDFERKLAARRPRPDRGAEQAGPMSSLTDRERELAALVGSGLSNAEISEKLFLSKKTVESHLTKIYRKLHLRSRSALAALIGQ